MQLWLYLGLSMQIFFFFEFNFEDIGLHTCIILPLKGCSLACMLHPYTIATQMIELHIYIAAPGSNWQLIPASCSKWQQIPASSSKWQQIPLSCSNWAAKNIAHWSKSAQAKLACLHLYHYFELEVQVSPM